MRQYHNLALPPLWPLLYALRAFIQYWWTRLVGRMSGIRFSLISFDDFLVDDFASTAAYICRRKLAVVYRSLLIFAVANYLLYPSSPYVYGRAGFSVLMLYAVFRTFWAIPSKSVADLRRGGVIDILVGYGVSIYFSFVNPFESLLIGCFLFFALCFLSPSLPVGLTGAIFTGVSSAVLYKTNGGKLELPAAAIHFTLLYSFFLVLMQAYSNIVIEHCRHFFQERDKLQAEAQTKNMFVASISHDLKNPLNSLLGCVDQLKSSTAITGSDRRLLKTATFSGQILIYLVNNILDIARIQAGKFEVDRLPMCISEVLGKILKIEGELSKKKGITLYKKSLTPIPKLVYGDPMRFAEVLINLLGNSIKFTTHGYVAVLVRWARNVGEIQDQEERVGRKFSRDEDDSEFIPPEEYFMLGPRISGTRQSTFSTRRISCSRRGPRSEEEDVNEGLTEYVADKIAKYNVASRGGKVQEAQSLYIPSALVSPINAAARANKSSTRFITVSDINLGGSMVPALQSKDPEATIKRDDQTFSDMDRNDEYEADIEEGDFGDSGLLVIDIIDTGVGMTKEEQARLFKPFSQANSSIKSKFGGTGLGLCISKQLTHLMSGFIEVKSQKGRGSRFKLTLPLKAIKGDVADLLRSPTEGRSGDMEPPTTLRCKTPFSALPPSGNQSRTFSQLALGMRGRGRARIKGSRSTLSGIRILVVEHEAATDESQLEQILAQLKDNDCELTYAGYMTAVQVLKDAAFKFDCMLILSATPALTTKRLVTLVMKTIKDSGARQIPFAVASGLFHASNVCRVDIAGQAEYNELVNEFQITFPLKDGDLENTLLKMRSKYM